MPYIDKDTNGLVTGYYGAAQFDGQAFVPDTDPGLLAFQQAMETLRTLPQVISRRQFFQQLSIQGVITQTEALAAVQTGSIPAAMQALINGLPKEAQFSATMAVAGSPEFNLNDPLVTTLATAFGWSQSQVDACWTAANQLV